MKYDLNYFIQKFEAIPENKWTTGQFVDERGCKCAYGHCGENNNHLSKEAKALVDLIVSKGADWCVDLVDINDDKHNAKGFGTTPKQRVVNYLKSLKEK